ncbi:MAG: multidrug effflux MFS transporter [Cypionkella sp.]|nr:multidrug effflux MFS transporter [Cypionkella sp.]
MPVTKPLRQSEFVALIAALFAIVAISIDAMLPALPQIAASLSPDAPNRAQLVVTSFVFGMGLGTLFMGPLADRFGRKPVIIAGILGYMLAALACYFATSLSVLLVARMVMGIAASAPRTVSTALVRDLFKGRAMAQVMSFVMMVFTLVPAVAPWMGQQVIYLAGWHAIYLAYMLIALATMLWVAFRQPETLAPQNRRSLALGSLWTATKELLGHRIVVLSILCQALTLGSLFATLSSMQGIFEQRFDQAENFPLWFAFIAMCAMSGSIISARVVMRVGMRAVVVTTYAGVLALTLALLLLNCTGLMTETLAFPAHLLWSIALFAMMGLSLGNLNALAMEPVGHIAGLAASVVSAIATVGSVLLAIPVGLAFDGTAIPLMTGVSVFVGLALVLMIALDR